MEKPNMEWGARSSLPRYFVLLGLMASALLALRALSALPFAPMRSLALPLNFRDSRDPVGSDMRDVARSKVGLVVGVDGEGFVEWRFSRNGPFPNVVQANFIATGGNPASLTLEFPDQPDRAVVLQDSRRLFLRDVPVDYGDRIAASDRYALRVAGKAVVLQGVRFYRTQDSAPALWRLLPLLAVIIAWGVWRRWRREHWILLSITAIGAGLRWRIFQDYYSVHLEGDASGYWSLAHAIRMNPFLTGNREPGFPWLLRVGAMLFGDSERTARFVSFLFSLGCIPATFFTAKRFGCGTLVGLIASALVAFNPFAIHMSAQGLQLEVFTVLIMTFALVWRKDEPLGLGLWGGLLTILRVQSVLAVIPLMLYRAWRRRWGPRRAILFALGFAALALPYFMTMRISQGSFFHDLDIHVPYYAAAERTGDPDLAVAGGSIWDYIFREHSPIELSEKTLAGYGQILLNPKNAYNQLFLNARFASRFNLFLCPFLWLGLVVCLRRGLGRELLLVPLLFLGGMPFLQDQFREWRLLFHVAPFFSLVTAIGIVEAFLASKRRLRTTLFGHGLRL